MDCLEQLVGKNSGTLRRTIVDVYDFGTVALYTPPPMKFEFQPINTSSHIGGYQSNLRDFGIGSREDLYNFQVPKNEPIIMPKQDYNMPDLSSKNYIDIVPYNRGMDLDGGLKLYGNKNSAILNDPSTGIDYHHHNLGGGSINIGTDRLTELSWSRQSKINEWDKWK